MVDPVTAVLWIPIVAAGVLALVPGYRLGARLSVAASALTLAAASSLLAAARPPAGTYLIVDDRSIGFLLLNCIVGFTRSVCSASYIGHELVSGRLPPR